ncbi:MAG: hypothetical protein JWM44_4009 [Bacilli bacterium]|jgi:uncharacterized membrane protein YgdD (TMEM256/DUF423 family)|nr:hypothetical protein [Bacilli bacterium]
MFRTFLFLGSVNAFLAVALGAFGAHQLKKMLSADMLSVYQTGVQYQMYHALALIVIALVSTKVPNSAALSWSGWLFFTGIVLFSGSLYALSLSGIKNLGAITPLGGLAFLIGWVMLAVVAWKHS